MNLVTEAVISSSENKLMNQRRAVFYPRLRSAWQRPACTRFFARAGDCRFCVLCDSDRLVAQWRH